MTTTNTFTFTPTPDKKQVVERLFKVGHITMDELLVLMDAAPLVSTITFPPSPGADIWYKSPSTSPDIHY